MQGEIDRAEHDRRDTSRLHSHGAQQIYTPRSRARAPEPRILHHPAIRAYTQLHRTISIHDIDCRIPSSSRLRRRRRERRLATASRVGTAVLYCGYSTSVACTVVVCWVWVPSPLVRGARAPSRSRREGLPSTAPSTLQARSCAVLWLYTVRARATAALHTCLYFQCPSLFVWKREEAPQVRRR